MLALGNTGPTRDLPLPNPEASDLPQHIAIIMDGNRRWAGARGLPKAAGHAVGARRVPKINQSVEKVDGTTSNAKVCAVDEVLVMSTVNATPLICARPSLTLPLSALVAIGPHGTVVSTSGLTLRSMP